VNKINIFSGIFAAVGAGLSWYLGGIDSSIYVIISFVIADYITGVMCAIVKRELSSEIGFKGIFKKILIFLLIGAANLLDTNVMGGGTLLRTAVIFFYTANEGVSLIENAAVLGLPVPQKLTNILKQLKEKNDAENN
jgi:toxin secretion/phage lysis holin